MWLTIISAILPTIISLLTRWISASDASKETKKKYLEFVYAMQQDVLAPKRLRDSFEVQSKRLDDMQKKIEQIQ